MNGRTSHLTAGLAWAALVLAGFGAQALGAPQANAATVAISEVQAVVTHSGLFDPTTGQATTPVVVAGQTLDASTTDNLVAAQDYATYTLSVSYGGASAGDTAYLVATLPLGVAWYSTSIGAASCNAAVAGVPVGGSITGNGTTTTSTLRCAWTVTAAEAAGNAGHTLTFYAKVLSAPAYNGMTFEPTFTDGNAGAASSQWHADKVLTVVAAPAMDIYPYVTVSSDGQTTFSGQPGYQIRNSIAVGRWNSDLRGVEALAAGATFDIKLTAGVQFMGCTSWRLTAVCTPDAADSTVVHVKITGATTDFVTGSYLPATTGSVDLSLFVPFSSSTPPDAPWTPPATSGGAMTASVTWQVENFDPDGLACATFTAGTPEYSQYCLSNYGGGYSPGQPSTATPQVISGSGGNARTATLSYYPTSQPSQAWRFYERLGSAQAIYGTYYQTSGGSVVVPGEAFVAVAAIGNYVQSGPAMTGMGACLTWDSNLVSLTGPITVLGVAAMPGPPGTDGTPSSVMTGGVASVGGRALAPLTASSLPSDTGYTLMYGYDPTLNDNPPAAQSTLYNYNCATSGITWSTTPIAQTNVVRLVTQNLTLAPSEHVLLALPVVRTTTAQSLALVPGAADSTGRLYFYTSETFAGMPNTVPTTLDRAPLWHVSGYVRADLAMVHATTTVTPLQPVGGDTVTFTVTPTVIGPVGYPQTMAQDVSLTMSFDSACVDLVGAGTLATIKAQLTAAGYSGATLQVYWPQSSTWPDPASLVADPSTQPWLAGCTSSSASPLGPVIVANLGGVKAPGTAVGATPASITAPAQTYGNETYMLNPTGLQVPVALPLVTPTGWLHLSTTIDSPSTTEMWRRYTVMSAVRPSLDVASANQTTAAEYRLSFASAKIVPAQGFIAAKTAATAAGPVTSSATGVVSAGESFSYTLKLENAQLTGYGPSSFYDVLPFPDEAAGPDPRVPAGSPNGLGSVPAGTAMRLKVNSVVPDMVDGSGNHAAVKAYCTSADPLNLLNLLRADTVVVPKRPFTDVDAAAAWVDCTPPLAVPAGTTALKFEASQDLGSYWTMSAVVNVTAPCMTPGGVIGNDMAYRAPQVGVLPLQEAFLNVPLKLASNTAALSGTVYRDLNFSGTFDVRPGDAVPPDGYWPAGATVGLYEADGTTPVTCPCNGQPYTATVGANGAYSFPIIPPGTYTVALTSVPTAPTWKLIATDTTSDSAPVTRGPAVWSADATIVNPVVVLPATTRAVDNLLYQALFAPAVSVVVTGPASEPGVVGTTIPFTYTVSNYGDADLTNVTIASGLGLTDIVCGPAPGTPNGTFALAAGASIVCTGHYTPVTQADIDWGAVTETATVTGTDPTSAVTAPSAQSKAIVVIEQNPTGPILKSAALDDVNGNGKADVGEQIVFTVQFANQGNVTLSLLTVTDSMPGLTLGCVDQDGLPVVNGDITLAPTQSVTCTSSVHVVTLAEVAAGAVKNTATITGQAGTVDPTTRQGRAGGVSGSSTVVVPALIANNGGALAGGAVGGLLAGVGLMVLGGWLLVRRLVGGREAGETV